MAGCHCIAGCIQEAAPSGAAVASCFAVAPSAVVASWVAVAACWLQTAAVGCVGCCCATCCPAGIHSVVLAFRSAVVAAGVPDFVGAMPQHIPFRLH